MPGGVPALGMNDPRTCPSEDMPQVAREKLVRWVIVTVQVVDVDEKPEPVKEKTDPTDPDVGVTEIPGIIVIAA